MTIQGTLSWIGCGCLGLLALGACGVSRADVPTAACGEALNCTAFSLHALPVLRSLTSTTPADVPGAAFSVSAEVLEEVLLARVNRDRAAHRLPPVTFDAQLQGVARQRAEAQAAAPARQVLSHDDATGSLAFVRLLGEAGLQYHLAGENLVRQRLAAGASAAETVDVAERALMGSHLHRENILTPGFDRMAAGVAWSADGRVVFVQLFRSTQPQ